MQIDLRLQVFSGDHALQQLKLVIPPENLISRLGGSSQFDPCVTDLGFPLSRKCAENAENGELKADNRHDSAKSTQTNMYMDVG